MGAEPSHLNFNPPKQDRSRATMNRLAAAALELMEEEGSEGATVAAIVERAGTSVGSFYARFPGKEDLIRYVRAQVWSDARVQWDAALEGETWADLSLKALLEGVVGLLLKSFRKDFRRRRVLGRDVSGDPEAARQLLAFHDHLLATVTPLVLSRREEVSREDPKEAVAFGYRCVVGAIREFLELEEAEELSPEGSSRDRGGLGSELAQLWLAYLAPGDARGPEVRERKVDFFDPWG